MLRVLLLAPLSLAAIGCGDDPLPVFVDVQYQLSREFGGGVVGGMRNFFNSNGVDGLEATCSVRSSGANQIFSLSAYQGTDFGIELRNVVFPAGGGELVGAACQIVILDEDNTYTGSCGSVQPAGDCTADPRMRPDYNCVQPCRVYEIRVGTGMQGPNVSLNFYCQGLGLSTDPTRVVEVSINGNGTEAPMFPSSLIASNCDGLAQE
jgi:hypothetical protein